MWRALTRIPGGGGLPVGAGDLHRKGFRYSQYATATVKERSHSEL